MADMKRKQEEQKVAFEAKKQQELQERQRKIEEIKKKQIEEMAKKKEMEDIKRKMAQAQMNVRRVIQKLRLANPENIEEFKTEADKVFEQETENLGTSFDQIKKECDMAREIAQKRVDVALAHRQKEQEKKEAAEKLKRDGAEKATAQVKELEELLETAENQCSTLKKAHEQLEELSKNKDASIPDAESAVEAMDAASNEAKESAKACSDYVLKQGNSMKATMSVEEHKERQTQLSEFLARISTNQKSVDAILPQGKILREAVKRKAAARAKTNEMDKVCAKYCKNKDKQFAKPEVKAFAKGEYQMTLTDDAVNTIFKNMVQDGNKGIAFDQLSKLKIYVGVYREKLRDDKRQQLVKEKEAALKQLQNGLATRIAEAKKVVDSSDAVVKAAEEKVNPLMAQVKSLSETEITSLATETESVVKRATDALGKAKKALDNLSAGTDDRFKDSIKDFVKKESKDIFMRTARFELRLKRATNLCKKFRHRATTKRLVENQKLRESALIVMKFNQRSKKLSDEDFFTSFRNGKADGKITEKEFSVWFKSADTNTHDVIEEDEEPKAEEEAKEENGKDAEMKEDGEEEKKDEATSGEDAAKEKKEEKKAEPAKPAKPEPVITPINLSTSEVSRVFGLLQDGAAGLSKDGFLKLVKVYLCVVKETALTSGFAIKESKPMRRLERNEVVEVLAGPKVEPVMKVKRVQARAVKDGAEGWITMEGNQGTSFMKECEHQFKVVKETTLSDSFEIAEGEAKPKESGQKLKVGDILEVLEWPKKEETSGELRMKVKLEGSDVTGWATAQKATTWFLTPVCRSKSSTAGAAK